MFICGIPDKSFEPGKTNVGDILLQYARDREARNYTTFGCRGPHNE